MASSSPPGSSSLEVNRKGVKRPSDDHAILAPKRPRMKSPTQTPVDTSTELLPPLTLATTHQAMDDFAGASRSVLRGELLAAQADIDGLTNLLSAANAKAAYAREELLERRNSEMQLRQNILFDAECRIESAQNGFEQKLRRMAKHHGGEVFRLQTALRDAQIALGNLQQTMDEQRHAHQYELTIVSERYKATETELNTIKSKYQRALSESTFYQSAHDAAEAALTTSREDFKELQRVVHEDKVAQERRRLLGLPPAYGSLDEDPLAKAPYGRHDDGGNAHIAMLKLVVRENFDDLHIKAQYKANEDRHSNTTRRLGAGTELFLDSTRALYDTCNAMSEFIEKANDVQVSSRSKQKSRVEDSSQTFGRTAHTAIVADRVAKLIIECCNKLLAGMEMHFYEANLQSQHKTHASLHWRIIDDTTRNAVEISITGMKDPPKEPVLFALSPSGATCRHCDSTYCTGHCGRMFAMYSFKIQIMDICRRLSTMKNRYLDTEFFGETLTWLNENIEIERGLAANAYLPPTRQPSPADPPPPSPTLVDEPMAGPSDYMELDPTLAEHGGEGNEEDYDDDYPSDPESMWD